MPHLPHFPSLETDRLVLTQIETDDSESILELFSSESVVEFYNLEVFTSLQQAADLIALLRNRFESETGIRWAIRDRSDNKFIGTCGFNSWNTKERSAVIGYDILPTFWGRGFATEAISGIIRAGFSGLLTCGALHRIQADTMLCNTASEKVLLKVGFQEEGIRRGSGYWKGSYHDQDRQER